MRVPRSPRRMRCALAQPVVPEASECGRALQPQHTALGRRHVNPWRRSSPSRTCRLTFRSNGTANPEDAEYQALARERVHRVEAAGRRAASQRPTQFTLAQLARCPVAPRSRATIASRAGVRSASGQACRWREVLALVRPAPDARYVVFHCADPMGDSGTKYYESIDMEDAYHPQTILAYELERRGAADPERRTAARPHRAPTRLQDGEVHHAHRAR